jgi:hypothetical protein
VEDEVWRKNLWSLRYQILKNVEKAIGRDIVTDIEFRVIPPRREAQREALPALTPADEAASIADPGLRRIYISSRRREIA